MTLIVHDVTMLLTKRIYGKPKGLSKIKLPINQQRYSKVVPYHAHHKLFYLIAMIELW